MKLSDFEKLLSEHKQKIRDDYDAFKYRFETRTDGFQATFDETNKYLQIKYADWDIYNKESVESIYETLQEILESDSYKESKKYYKPKAYFDIEAYSDGDDAYIDYSRFRVEWWVLKEFKDEVVESQARNLAKADLTIAIKRHKNIKDGTYLNLDCKLVQLWLDKKIDFETLCDISTSNCKL